MDKMEKKKVNYLDDHHHSLSHTILILFHILIIIIKDGTGNASKWTARARHLVHFKSKLI